MFYTESQKLTYQTPCGRSYDPLALQRRLVIAGGDKFNDHLATWAKAASEVDRARAEEALVVAARTAFTFKPFDAEDGVTDSVVLAALEHFLRWLEGKDLRGPTPQP